MEQFISSMIFLHAGFGGKALVSGAVAMIATKGGRLHKKSGLIFYYTMLIGALSAMLIAVLPEHESPFFFAVGMFSLYFILAGKRALRFKYANPNLSVDKWISSIMLFTGLLMCLAPIIVYKQLNMVLLVFGIVAMVFSTRDLYFFTRPEYLKAKWLQLHLGKTTGAYISSFTAFVVVNQFFSGLFSWFAPSIVGGFFIYYWIRKVSQQKESAVN